MRQHHAQWTISVVPAAEGHAYVAVDSLRRADHGLFRRGTTLFGAKDVAIDELTAYLAHNYQRYLQSDSAIVRAEAGLDKDTETFILGMLREIKLEGADLRLNGQTIADLISGSAGPMSLVVGEIANGSRSINPMLLIVAVQDFLVICGAREGVETALRWGLEDLLIPSGRSAERKLPLRQALAG
jgi:hypothetical protein